MTKHRITCATTAVWLAKHHGIKFRVKNDYANNAYAVLIPSPHRNRDGVCVKGSKDGRLYGSADLSAFSVFYVHEDSLADYERMP